MIHDEPSPTSSPFPKANIIHQAEKGPRTPSPINTSIFHQGGQGESNSNFETIMLSQLSLIV